MPSKAALETRDVKQLVAPLRQPLRTTLDGISVTYVPFVAPPRPRSYGVWGAWAAPTLALALKGKRFDLVHAHYAAPAGDAVRRARIDAPLVISVHGGDVLALPERWRGGREAVTGAFEAATLTLANSTAIAERSERLGAHDVRVVHLGTDVPEPVAGEAGTLVSVGNLIARKRHGDVLRALWLLRDDHPELRWIVVGGGPERAALEQLATELELTDRVDFRGALPPAEAQRIARSAAVFVLPSVDEAFGVAYIEAMAGGVPAIGSRGEPGPEEIARFGDGMRLVPPGDPEALAQELRKLLGDPEWRRELGAAARATVIEQFTWDGCGKATVAAYEDALEMARPRHRETAPRASAPPRPDGAETRPLPDDLGPAEHENPGSVAARATSTRATAARATSTRATAARATSTRATAARVTSTRATSTRATAPRGDARPVLFVTNHAPAFRIPAFAALHERERVVFALIGGDVRHGGGGTSDTRLPFPAVFPEERAIARMAASGKYRAVVAGLSGRVALPSAYAGARAGRVPFVLWATIWRHPRTSAHALSYPPLRHMYRHADAIVTYGPHVSAYVRTKHPQGEVFEAPQSVDVDFWTAPADRPERHGDFQILYAGRLEHEKGVDVLATAWNGDEGTLVLAGDGPLEIPGAISRGRCNPTDLRNLYAGSDVVVVPSVPTRDFLEPWGLVVNEAFHQGVPVIATDAVGAAAGGLVRHERTGLVVRAGDPVALGQALHRLRADPELRAQLGAAGRTAAAQHTPAAWADGVSKALTSVQKGLLA